MKKFLVAIIAILVVAMGFALVGCDTKNVETIEVSAIYVGGYSKASGMGGTTTMTQAIVLNKDDTVKIHTVYITANGNMKYEFDGTYIITNNDLEIKYKTSNDSEEKIVTAIIESDIFRVKIDALGMGVNDDLATDSDGLNFYKVVGETKLKANSVHASYRFGITNTDTGNKEMFASVVELNDDNTFTTYGYTVNTQVKIDGTYSINNDTKKITYKVGSKEVTCDYALDQFDFNFKVNSSNDVNKNMLVINWAQSAS